MNKSNILILGSSTKAGMYVTKQFHKQGYSTTLVDWKDLPVKYSRYVNRYIHLGSPETDLAEFEKALLQHIEHGNYSCILPLNDVALEVAYRVKTFIPPSIKILGLNPPGVYQYAHNKWELIQLAAKTGIATPATLYADTLEVLESKLDQLTFPCVIKPPCSALHQHNKIINFTVRYANDREQLIDIVREHINNTPLLIQELISGFGIGYNLIANEGEVFNAYIHKRINERKGVSSFREALGPAEFGLQPFVEKLVKEMNWSGVAMIEFKVQHNVPVLMEMNGRFYGSIDLAVKSGLNFPVQLLNMELKAEMPQKNIPVKKGVKVRNLHDEVLIHYSLLVKGKVGEFIKWNLSVIKTLFSRNEYIEDNLFDDPGFVLGLYWSDIKRIVKKLSFRVKLRVGPVKRSLFKLTENKSLNIGFVCMGNICRSPFAEAYARKINSAHHYYSFGTYAIDRRMPPRNAVRAASRYNIDLNKFMSTTLSRKLADSMDYLVVMDKLNYFELIKLGVPKHKIRFLDKTDIADPYSKNEQYFEYIYKKIASAMDAL